MFVISVFLSDGAVCKVCKYAIIIILYKRNRAKTNYGIHSGISQLSATGKVLESSIALLSAIGKVLSSILHTYLNGSFVNDNLPETQCGFRSGLRTIDNIYTTIQIQVIGCE